MEYFLTVLLAGVAIFVVGLLARLREERLCIRDIKALLGDYTKRALDAEVKLDLARDNATYMEMLLDGSKTALWNMTADRNRLRRRYLSFLPSSEPSAGGKLDLDSYLASAAARSGVAGPTAMPGSFDGR